jgi:hypothetical protein
MKLINPIKVGFFALAGIYFLSACNNNDKPTSLAKNDAPPKALNPFPFYKSIEIKPGFNFEVVSWGKGIDTLGGYLLLMSDSLKNNYKSTSVERNGIITDAWNMDLDNDGNPELYIQYLVRKNVTDLNVFEFVNNSFDKISFPGLNSSLKKGYQGNDKFYVKNGDLFRAVPVVNVDSGKTTTVIKTIKYRLSGNNFSTSEVKPEN